jgi:benzoyl-CoA-dihydrodiol lyase
VLVKKTIDFQTDPSRYHHWRVEYDDAVANLYMDVDENAGLFDGYQLKLNSYDLGVDIELSDIVQRMRFEHPEVKVVVMRSAKDQVFCAGANIRMLGGAAHSHKVNFCKFTNETRNTYEAALKDSGQNYIAAVRGACAGGGYELALACNHIMLTDDSSSSVALPEVPLLAVLPGTGGLTRVTDKRKVRRDRADIFCSMEEGVKGKRAKEWGLVDEVIPNSEFNETVAKRAKELAASSNKVAGQGIKLGPLDRQISDDGSISYSLIDIELDRKFRKATITIKGPENSPPDNAEALTKEGDQSYLLKLARELDDAILHLRLNEMELGLWVIRTQGNPELVLAHEAALLSIKDHWLANEILQLWKRVLKRLDVTSRSIIAIVEHGSCFAGTLAEILWAADRSYMMLDEFEGDERPIAKLKLSEANFGQYPMANDLTRIQTRFLGTPEHVDFLREQIGEDLEAEAADEHGLVTYIYDDIDWEDERNGSKFALFRAGDNGNADLWPSDCVAKLDIQPAKCGWR